jgi:GntR family transcriptional repressor for pyruvate dehydrogenase complex
VARTDVTKQILLKGAIMFEYAKSNKVCENIVEQIRMAIFDGRFKPGDKLLSEKELIEKFRVSRGTLREALRSLESSGVLEIRKGVSGGAYITEIGIERAKENFVDFFHFKKLSLEHLIEVRLMLEPPIAAKVALAITSEDLKQLQASIDRCGHEMKPGVTGAQREGFLEFHHIIAGVTGNPILTFLLDVIKKLPVDGLDIGKKPTRKFSQEVLKAHSRIYEALLQRNPKRAREEMTRHILELGNSLLARNKTRSSVGRPKKAILPE